MCITVVSDAKTGEIVVQEYIERPLLLGKRKFDMRAFVLLASVDPALVLWWPEMYLRRFSFTSLFLSLTPLVSSDALKNLVRKKDAWSTHLRT